MKLRVIDLEGRESSQIELPIQFSEEYHPNLIKRAVIVIQSNKRHPYGAMPEAGQRASAVLSRRRRKYRGSYGKGISRVQRKIFWRRGTQFGWQAAVAPGTVKGRKAHPPKSSKILKKKINIKERRKAIRSALAATLLKNLVLKKPSLSKLAQTPIIIISNFESLDKTSKVIELFKKIGLEEELKRISERKIRAGKGKSRGRKYKIKKGPLIVVSKDCPLIRSASNIPGVDITLINNLNAELLAPGTAPGRLTIFSEAALEKMKKEALFLEKEVKKWKTHTPT